MALGSDAPQLYDEALAAALCIFHELGSSTYWNCTSVALLHQVHWESNGHALGKLFEHPRELSEEKAEVLIGFFSEQHHPMERYQFEHAREQWLELGSTGTAAHSFDTALQTQVYRKRADRAGLVDKCHQWLDNLVTQLTQHPEQSWGYRDMLAASVSRQAAKKHQAKYWTIPRTTKRSLRQKMAHSLKLLRLRVKG